MGTACRGVVHFAVATFFRIVSDIAWLYPTYALASMVNFLTTYSAGDSLSPILNVVYLFALAICVRYLAQNVAKRLMFGVSERVSLDAQVFSIAHMFKIDIAWHERENTGNKLKKIVRGGESMDRVLRMWVNNYIEIIINFVGIIIVILHFDKTIALLTIVFLVTYYMIARALLYRASKATQIVNTQEEEVQGVYFEALNNIRSVKVLGMAPALQRIIAKTSDNLFTKITKRIFWFQTGNTARGLWSEFFRLGMLVFIGYGIVHGVYEVGFLILFYGYFGKLTESVSELAEVTQDFIVAKFSIRRMTEVLDEPVRIDQIEGKQPFPQDWKKISLKDVSFSYGNHNVLQNISFDIRRGEKVGIVGLSGSGKSTVFKLLLKEHESYTGSILVDDVPLTDISKEDYFEYSAVVLQDTEVFSFSLRENIVLANLEQSENETLFEKAIRVSHVQDFLEKLPQGADTPIGEKGIKLSGGERQRVGIARAVFKEPQLLLLDEATSHLDIESEEKIRTSLHEFLQNVTAVVIAHRLTTIREMDRIIVIEEGGIVEEGSFDELYAKKGRFFELWESQRL
jgi:ABC-type multidrug transport system fused ATPase/permease subunit